MNEEKLEAKIYEEALAFPLTKFLKSDGSINTRKLKQLHPDFYQEALDLIFIKRAYEVHGKFFGYREVHYTTKRNLVKIWCPDHQGWFLQSSDSHLNGHGCSQCANTLTERETEVGTFTVPCHFHKYLIAKDKIIWYNKFNKLEMEIKQ